MITEILIVVILFALLVKASIRPSNFPPGPRGLPLAGYIPFLSKLDPEYPHLGLIKLADQYGPVTGFYLGPSQPFISVCGYEAIKEALYNDDLAGRPDNAARRERTFGQRLGVVHNDGPEWQEQRRFSLRHLRDLGFGKTSSEGLIREEIDDLMDEIRLQSGRNQPVDFKGMFNLSLINILWALIGGERFKRDDVRLARLLDIVDSFIHSANFTRANIPFPAIFLRLFPSTTRNFLGLRNDLFTPLQDFIRDRIQEHVKDRSDDEQRDFIDVYLQEMTKRQSEGDSSFHENQLIGVIIDLFIAGAETTSGSIGFALLYLLHHPEIQQKIQKELDQVCGDSLPQLAHRSSLLYTEAVLMEAQRLANITPLAVAHKALRDTHLHGYSIPKESIVTVNLFTVHHDNDFWKEPEIFRPERHLTPDGRKLIKTDHLLPFSAGKRACLGEPLARNTYFLFMTSLLKTFEFRPIPDRPLPTLKPKNGLTLGYDGFEAIVTPRT